ncbi:NAD(P)-binding protein [Artomyces pyxidatus]|uniref:NAD(P)-binding protein n=1 Tax=Artomyces pyxidatus TaxID=48021 RepID=A0ACB8T3R7_9AGAM|nr:NAD(P)-binding protein [Artomyces pyxidatus]
MTSLPKTQRAWRVVTQGLPKDALRLVTDLPMPTQLEPGRVLVKVEAAALNPVGYKMMRLLPNFLAKRPVTAEQDFSGVIVNRNGTKWADGDAVFGLLGEGSMAEYIAISATQLAHRPTNITPIQASGLGVCTLTAYASLFKLGQLEEGQSVLINGGSTAVGAFATQLAKSKGAKVTAVASGKNEEWCRKLGADEFIDYTKVDIALYLSKNPPATKYHVILEAVGTADPSLYAQSEKYLQPGGVFVSVGPQPHGVRELPMFGRLLFNVLFPGWMGGVSRRWTLVTVHKDGEILEKISTLITEGKVKPIVDSVFEFEDALKAYDRLMTSRATGKVVVKVISDTE